MYENILYEPSDGIATITLDRPDKLNAYTVEMGEELVAAFGCARSDERVRAVHGKNIESHGEGLGEAARPQRPRRAGSSTRSSRRKRCSRRHARWPG